MKKAGHFPRVFLLVCVLFSGQYSEAQIYFLPTLHALNKIFSSKEALLSPSHLELYRRAQKIPALKNAFPESLIIPILKDPTMRWYPAVFAQSIKNTLEDGEESATLAKFKEKLSKLLVNRVPKNQIEARVSVLGKPQITKKDFLRALGDMTYQEVDELIYGKDMHHPSADSLVGKYLKLTGARFEVRTFNYPNPAQAGTTLQGPPRIYLAVSPSTLAIYQKLFSLNNFMVHFGHALISQKGKVFSYHNHGDALVDVVANTRQSLPNLALAHVTLSSREAQRLEQFFLLFQNKYWKGEYCFESPDFVAMYPWSLPGYCAEGGYTNNCTQFIGNIPLGDSLVNEYTFPPDYEYGDQTVKTQKLHKYVSNDPIVKRVWTVPGHQQFADMLGQSDASDRGEFANAGWVMTSLMGQTSNARVPLVTIVTDDVKKPLPQDLSSAFEGPR